MNERAETAAQPTSGDTPLNLQRVLFAGPTPDTDADLYATVAGGHVDRPPPRAEPARAPDRR